MTWDHPRARRPLDAFAAVHPDAGTVRWSVQSLADFEARPLAELAREAHLLVVDHPSLGTALSAGVLLPLDELFTPEERAAWSRSSVGRTWESYSLEGAQWALPIDASTQVSVADAALTEFPRSWQEVPAFAREHRTVLGLDGPHALLTLLAMCAPDHPVPGALHPDLVDPDVAVPALELLHAVWRASSWNAHLDPIEVHEAVAHGHVDFCPLTYGYASYAVPAPGCRRVAWADAPTSGPQRAGSVLGGAGLALSRRCADATEEVRRWVLAFARAEVQASLVTAHSGQPAHHAAWDSPEVDRQWGGYYSSTRNSVERAWVRPRVDGWPAFQGAGSAIVRRGVTGGVIPSRAVTELNDAYRALHRSTRTLTGTGDRS